MKKIILTICLIVVCFGVIGASSAEAALDPVVFVNRDEIPVVDPVLMEFEEYHFPGVDIRVSYINYSDNSCIAATHLELANHLVDGFDWDFYIQGTGFEHKDPDAWTAIFGIWGPYGEPTENGERQQRSDISSYGMEISTSTDINFIPYENIEDIYSITARFTASPAWVIATDFFFNEMGDSWFATFVINGSIIPEPATIFLLGAGSLALICKRRKFV